MTRVRVEVEALSVAPVAQGCGLLDAISCLPTRCDATLPIRI